MAVVMVMVMVMVMVIDIHFVEWLVQIGIQMLRFWTR